MSTNVNFEKFTSEQMRFMVALADPNDHRTQEQIAQNLNVRPETLCRWKRLPYFGETLWELTYANLEAEIGRISSILLQKALTGDFRFVRLFFEVLRVHGVKRQATECTREHVLEIEEWTDELRAELTESELQLVIDEIKRACEVRKSNPKDACVNTDVFVSKFTCLNVA